MKDMINYFTSNAEVPVWTFFFVGLSWLVFIIALFIKTDALDIYRREIKALEEDIVYFSDGNEKLIYRVKKKEELLRLAQEELRQLRDIATRPSRVIDTKSVEERIIENEYKRQVKKNIDARIDKIAKKF